MGQPWFSDERLQRSAEAAVSKDQPRAVFSSGTPGPAMRSWADQVERVEGRRPNATGLAVSTDRWLGAEGGKEVEWIAKDGVKVRASWQPVVAEIQVPGGDPMRKTKASRFNALVVFFGADE